MTRKPAPVIHRVLPHEDSSKKLEDSCGMIYVNDSAVKWNLTKIIECIREILVHEARKGDVWSVQTAIV